MVRRRDFLKFGATAAISFTIPIESFADKKSEVFVMESENHRKATESIIEMLGGINRFISKGDIVAVKPNMAWAREPEYAANTNPAVVAEVVRLCYKAGAKRVIVTDNPCNNPRSVFSLSKIPEYAHKENAKVFVPQNRHYKIMNIQGKFLREWPVLEVFKKVDKVINIPVAKNHSSSIVTIGMKNWMGAIGGNRGYLHQNLHQAIFDLAMFFRPTLTIVDCTRIMLKGGPSGGDLKYVKKLNRVVASLDFVAADAVACEYLGYNPKDVGYLKLANEYKVGNIHKSAINLIYEKI
ncbi:DUF362 domain-containing protein [Deferribacter thermophilus]|uniref:DUF362 domain-containing protein n=1 Tax=Deferribacter thermophilus TaxID=53573 RepID=UPI003C237362